MKAVTYNTGHYDLELGQNKKYPAFVTHTEKKKVLEGKPGEKVIELSELTVITSSGNVSRSNVPNVADKIEGKDKVKTVVEGQEVVSNSVHAYWEE
jgi:hypothetical protein